MIKTLAVIQGVTLFFLVAAANATSDPAINAGFIPHKALYDIHLSSKKSGAMISNLSGEMMYEWHPSCDGWISNYQFNMLYDYTEMPSVRITSNVSTFESYDGNRFSFNVQREKDGHPFEFFRGATVTEENGFPDSVLYSVPKGLKHKLPKGTFFPMAHTLSVFKKIKQGKQFYNAVLFDGSDDKKPVNVNVFIGKGYMYHQPKATSKDNKNIKNKSIDLALVNTKAWNLRLAFFPLDSSDTVPDYEMSVVFHENGVISRMEIEYADFSIIQNLIAIEVSDTGCNMSISGGNENNRE